ncbi:hypothetical protein AJ79_09063 [Helicocarpus griseus UAMH5409]|uniref:Uncharacterized protein n=1 Tax=Helicocarpus griseus UAMH5409 TaxID=1447875 RepID=A0A2B7WN13_9EURO|nr:hypothetical protein AJ79_09063 [Helicocarpus griseus UAMH5409]
MTVNYMTDHVSSNSAIDARNTATLKLNAMWKRDVDTVQRHMTPGHVWKRNQIPSLSQSALFARGSTPPGAVHAEDDSRK